MKKLFSLCIPAIFLCLSAVVYAGPEIAVIQSSKIKPYDDAVAGFERFWSEVLPDRGQKAISPVTVKKHLLTDFDNRKALKRRLTTIKPDLLLVVGKSALELVHDFPDIPIVYLMVPHPEEIIRGRDNISGIDMQVEPEIQLAALLSTVPSVKRVGLIYDPANIADIVKKAQAFAEEKGISLVAKEAQEENEIPAILSGMEGEIDAFWMLPDKTVITSQSLVHIFLFSFANRIPILSFSDKYLKMGATVSVSFDVDAMGKQAAILTKKIIDERELLKVASSPAEEFNVAVNKERTVPLTDEFDTMVAGLVKVDVNPLIAKKLGVKISPKMLNEPAGR